RERAEPPGLDGTDLAGPTGLGRDRRDSPGAGRRERADDVALGEPLDSSVEAEAIEVGATAVADRRHDRLVVEPEDERLSRAGGVQVPGREERGRPVELRSELPEPAALLHVEVVVRPRGEPLRRLRDADQPEDAGVRPRRRGN